MNIITNIIEILFSDKWLPVSIVILSPIGAFIIDFIFTFVFKRFASKTKTSLDDKLIAILHQPVFYSAFFIGWMIAVKKTDNEYGSYVISILLSLVIIVWARAIFKGFIEFIKWYGAKGSSNKTFQRKMLPLFDNLGKLFIFSFCIYFLFKSWGWDVTGWLASAGVIGIVLGLAAKDSLANFFSGVFIMADAPYKENDYIVLDSGERGYVSKIGLRSTRIMTRDDIEITIPNSVIANSKIVNQSGGPYEKYRIRLDVGVAYGTDIDKVREILINIATSDDDISKDNTPRVRFRQFGDSSLMFQLLFWIDKPEMRGRVTDQINSKIYKTFNQENIEIPFPQRTIHIKKDD
tara:strand:- start:52 stop:1098 length:1047 start_codon:yes stop_codon:yes gene_type:complete